MAHHIFKKWGVPHPFSPVFGESSAALAIFSPLLALF